MKRIVSTLAAMLFAAAAFASQVCTEAFPRPVAKSTGFYVLGSQLIDPSGEPFLIRGVNHNHWDQTGAYTGIPLTGANTERIHVDFAQTPATNMKLINAVLAAGLVPIPGNWTGTCYQDAAHLTAAVDTWVAQAPTWTVLNGTGLINIANEWGPSNSPIWRDSYITAISRMRAAGYTGTLVVDAGGCGQDSSDIVSYGAAVLASDPLKNVLFDLHVYGSFSEPVSKAHQGLTDSMAALKATGLPILIGEFGPGSNIGPSPTMLTPEQIVGAAQDAGFGWIVWAYDDNDMTGCKTSDRWFGMVKYCAVYKTDADLTPFGLQMMPLLRANTKRAAFK
jgi:mannan endo-1,4-beta-mannosidase